MKKPLLVLLLVLSGCCAPRHELEDLPPDPGVYLELRKTDDRPGREYEVDVRFYLKGSTLDTIVQVIHLEVPNPSGGRTYLGSVVEAFKLDNGREQPCRVDRHWSLLGEYRWMEVYPAVVEGATWSEHHFAMLEENELGTRTTATWFNADHVSEHGIRGRVAFADRRNVTIWSIDATGDAVKVYIPPEKLAK